MHSPRADHSPHLSSPSMQSPHLAFCAAELRPKEPTCIHLVADHFSPFVVAQLPCKLLGSVSPSGFRLHNIAFSHALVHACIDDRRLLSRLCNPGNRYKHAQSAASTDCTTNAEKLSMQGMGQDAEQHLIGRYRQSDASAHENACIDTCMT